MVNNKAIIIIASPMLYAPILITFLYVDSDTYFGFSSSVRSFVDVRRRGLPSSILLRSCLYRGSCDPTLMDVLDLSLSSTICLSSSRVWGFFLWSKRSIFLLSKINTWNVWDKHIALDTSNNSDTSEKTPRYFILPNFITRLVDNVSHYKETNLSVSRTYDRVWVRVQP